MTDLQMPPARDFGWELRPNSSSHFAIRERSNGQFCVVLNHALLRGCSATMIHWWFLHFPNLLVKLVDIPPYESQRVPAYYLWHPVDHYSATLSGRLGPNDTARPGASIKIREAMQYEMYGWKYPVDTSLKIFYVGADGWAMGKSLPFLGPVMMLRIHFRDVAQDGRHIGAHYHYEVVIGVGGDNFLARQINKGLSAKFGPEFFEAWHRHNVIEVGVFENFLPALYAQRNNSGALEYRREMDCKPMPSGEQNGHDRTLFQKRLDGYESTENPFHFQQYDQPSFL